MATGKVYVYGVVHAGRTPPADRRGVGSPPARPRMLRAGPLAAVVSTPPERLLARRRDLLAHQDVLLALAAEGPVIPMRFGVVAPDAEAVRRRLREDEAEHLATLERLDGRLEMNLKAFPVEEAMADLVREDRTVRRLREAARRRPGYEASVRLGEAVAAGLRRRAAEAAASALRELASLAEATAPGPELPECVGNVSFLVAAAREPEFRATAERRAAELGDRAELRLSGPLPCFSFVTPRPETAGTAAHPPAAGGR
ncbi:GvpL/GvpF family gas vesicle protein [Streptomyces millisiae]|uniref:GvpL/GvpF family gas vesicle protein n=1 Tax=Streptomyces millisiae TaxID=3075542 RepID=A0ABU2LSG5_9ACTN|nr:GvpL/GvpF family gas vesicle protein [Streptomyces sp. DSM 44918]MDT0320528.1 GvpL/GvpF family gas vesicle protein [Streptomyces sp. DSM 44918]